MDGFGLPNSGNVKIYWENSVLDSQLPANFGHTQNIPTVIWQGLQTASTGPSELALSAGGKIKSHFWPSMHLTLMR